MNFLNQNFYFEYSDDEESSVNIFDGQEVNKESNKEGDIFLEKIKDLYFQNDIDELVNISSFTKFELIKNLIQMLITLFTYF